MAAVAQQSPQDNPSGPDATTSAATVSVRSGHQIVEYPLKIKDRVFFEPGQAVISQQEAQSLGPAAHWLQEYHTTNVTIEGHADERGTRKYNLALGEDRAAAMKRALIDLGVSPDRTKTISYGKDKPVIQGHAESARAQNRCAIATVDQ